MSGEVLIRCTRCSESRTPVYADDVKKGGA